MARRPGSLTNADLLVLQFIEQFRAGHGGMPPSLSEIASSMGWNSKATAHRHVAALVATGRLSRTPTGLRRLQAPVTGAARPPWTSEGGVPFVERLAPGTGAITPSMTLRQLPPPPAQLGEEVGLFAFLADDDVMAAVGIPKGTLVYAQQLITDLKHEDLVAWVSARAVRPSPLVVRRFATNPQDSWITGPDQTSIFTLDRRGLDDSRIVGIVRAWFVARDI